MAYMSINEPCCGFQNCKYQFDGNCTNKNRYERCEYMNMRFFLLELQEKMEGNEELKEIIDLLI